MQSVLAGQDEKVIFMQLYCLILLPRITSSFDFRHKNEQKIESLSPTVSFLNPISLLPNVVDLRYFKL